MGRLITARKGLGLVGALVKNRYERSAVVVATIWGK
jgi:hypothetical protein